VDEAAEPRRFGAHPPRRGGLELLVRDLALDRFEAAALMALTAISLALLLLLLPDGRPLSGADGTLPPDQLQYFAWIREASEHGLIGNLFDLAPGERVFLHPGFVLSGLAHRLTGASIPLSYQLWKPVAVAVTFVGTLAYVRRLLPPGGQRRVALVLSLFAVMPAAAVVAWTDWGGNLRAFAFDFIAEEMWSAGHLWGYLMTSIAVFLMPLVLLALESWRESRRRRTLLLASAGAGLVCWLQPWQGMTLALIVIAVEALRFLWGRARPAAPLMLVPTAVALPALYYLLLSLRDPSWRLAAEQNAPGALVVWSWPWWAVAVTVLPFVVPAALAYRLPADGWQETAVRVWPLAALLVYVQPLGTFPYHAFQGLALPLAILATQGVASVWPRPRPVLVATALALLVLPGLVHKVELGAVNIDRGEYPYFITPDEHRALEALRSDPRVGGVLARPYTGYFVPYTTGRETYVGAVSWSPDFPRRSALATALFQGGLGDEQARAFVHSTGARFLFSDCGDLADLDDQLEPLLESVRRYGCATLYVLRAPSPRPRG
jgi:hypothetical protein